MNRSRVTTRLNAIQGLACAIFVSLLLWLALATVIAVVIHAF